MSASHGYNNTKAQGRPIFDTVHELGSSKTAKNVVMKSLAEVSAVPSSIVSVTQSKDGKELAIEITAHGAKVGDVFRVMTGICAHVEYDILRVTDANVFVVANVIGSIPAIADTGKIMFYVTSKSDAEGNVNFSPGPAQFVQDGTSVTVREDSAVPANNRPSPSAMYFTKDGVKVPVTKDTANPNNTAAMPVEIVAVDGTNININAGDIQVQLSDLGVNFDATRIGDGSGSYLAVNADGSINTLDTQVRDAIQTITATHEDPALPDGVQMMGKRADYGTVDAQVALGLEGDALSILTDEIGQVRVYDQFVDSSVITGANRIAEVRDRLPSVIGSNLKSDSLSVTLASDEDPIAVSGPLTDAQLRATAVPVSGPLTNTQLRATAVDIASNQLPTTLGQKTAPNSLSVVLASGTAIEATITGGATETKQDTQITHQLTQITELQDIEADVELVKASVDAMSAKLPSSLGAKTAANSLSVALATDQALATTSTPVTQAGTITSAQLSVGTSAVRATVAGTAPSASRKKLIIKPSKNNSGNIYLGGSTVTTANGMEIIGPDRVEFEMDSGDYYLISDTSGQTVEIIEKV